jgi:gliding motility-associated-like protein
MVETNLYGCKSDTARLSINIILPQPVIHGTRVVCPNSRKIRYFITNPNTSSQYNWGCRNGKRHDAGNLPYARYDWGDQGNASVWVIETTKEGCISDTSFFTVAISYKLETPPIEGDTFLCEGSLNVPYKVAETNGSNYAWWVQKGQLASANGFNEVLIDWIADGKGLVRVIQTAYDSVNNKACQSDPVELSVTLNPLPETTSINGPDEICQYNTALYSVNGFPGSLFSWSISGPNVFTGQGTDQIQLNWNTDGNYNITVFETTKYNCVGSIVDTAVVVHPKPRTSPIYGDSVICYPDNLSKIYQVTGFVNSVFNWSVIGGNILNNYNNNIEVEWIAGEYGTVKVTELSEFGCKGDERIKNVILDSLRAEIKVVTTAEDNDKRIEVYVQFYNAAHMSRKARIFKSVKSEQSWIIFDSLDASKNMILDGFVKTHSEIYDYRVAVFNLCNNIFASEPHHSVLLRGDKVSDFNLDLRWNLYTGWAEGVERYDIFRSLNKNREFTFFEGNFHDTMADILTGNDGYKQCYRVVAIKSGDESVKSWSNEICFNFEPVVFVPNSFTPNEDGLNDVFKVVAGNVAIFEMSVYSVWGEKIFYSQSADKGWDGTYNGNKCPVGVYMVVINYSGNSHNETYAGSITLLK